MSDYRLLTYEGEEGPTAGILIGDRIHPTGTVLGSSAPAHTILDILDRWDASRPLLEAAAASPPSGGKALDSVRLLAPLLYPPTVYYTGANYWDHVLEMAELNRDADGNLPSTEKPADPWLNIKASQSTVIGPGAPIRIPAFSKMLDWEAEIALVVGRPGRNLTPANALDCLAGMAIGNDLSARDFVKRENSIFVWDWLAQKCFDGSTPLGPWITPLSAIPDPSAMSIQLWVNDELKQDSNASQLVHDFSELLVYLSLHVTLQPGDVILTGTPAGVGFPTGDFLQPGDIVRIAVEGCGVLENPVVDGV
ncbi:MAG: fumarylacetoacetate hydrolase family protein [bacterium]|nr:2-keto-4-pentenoate hydratase [Deltaproteobacteria bacterium]MCP4904837.1 fumarylacetoacetate hydrolase family protein [bacterium]